MGNVDKEAFEVIEELLEEYLSSGFTECRDSGLIDRAKAVLAAQKDRTSES